MKRETELGVGVGGETGNQEVVKDFEEETENVR